MRSVVIFLLTLSLASPGAAQVSAMGTTAMGLPTTPGVIVSSPLNGPSPFTSLAQSTAPVTTLAPVPTAQDPTTPGTVVTCSATSGTTASTPSGMSTIPSPIGNPVGASLQGSAIGTVSSSPVLGGSTLTSNCSASSGDATNNGAALPLFIPSVPDQPAVGTIQAGILAPTSSSADVAAMPMSPTPNASACSQSVSIDLSAQAMAASATGAAATPGVMPAGC